MPTAAPKSPSSFPWWLETLLTFCLFFLTFSSPPPGVNESHYLTKAKHFWDPSFAPHDIFLDSSNAHWLFFTLTGWITLHLTLAQSAWVLRGCIWLFQAAAWCWMIRPFTRLPLTGPVTSLFFIASLNFTHLAGEWADRRRRGQRLRLRFRVPRDRSRRSTSLALGLDFPRLLNGLSCTRGWLGDALFLLYALVYRYQPNKRGCDCIPSLIRFHAASWILGLAIASLGIIPALTLNQGIPAADSQQGAFIYVYRRLTHHLSPLYFAGPRWPIHLAWLAFVAVVAAAWRWSFPAASSLPTPASCELSKPTSEVQNANAPWQLLWWLGYGASAIAILGLAIDASLASYHPQLAASLLRYYWFRWHDVAWPLIIALSLPQLAFPLLSTKPRVAWLAILLLVIPSSLWLIARVQRQWDQTIPDADRHALLSPSSNRSSDREVYQDWLAVCQWIRETTPPDSIWMTPQHQQTFKWYAERQELANWKDVPQDASRLVEWLKRFDSLYDRSNAGRPAYTIPEKALAFASQYQARYLLIDLRQTQELPPFPRLYPEPGPSRPGTSRGTFTVLAIPTTAPDLK